MLDRIYRHNLRNDMSVVLGLAEDIERQADGDLATSAAAIQDKAVSMMANADKERELVHLITETPLPQRLDVVDAIRQQADAARQNYPAATIEADAPDSVTASVIEEFGTAIAELLENAIEHCDRQPQVTITVERTPELVTVRVADNGPAIPDQERSVLQTQGDIDELSHGSGIGLWFVYWVVRLSDGRLSFDANEPRGNVVTLEFDRQ